MPDGNIDIFIESSFFAVASGTVDIPTSFWAGQLESIGQRDIVTDYALSESIPASINADAEAFITYSGAFQSGYTNVLVDHKTSTSTSGVEVALVDYAIPASTSGLTRTEDAELEYFTGYTQISGLRDVRSKFIAGETFIYARNILGTYHIFGGDVVERDYATNYTAGGYYTPSIPGPPEDQVINFMATDFYQYFTAGAATISATIQQDCELFLAGYPMEFKPQQYTYRFHIATGDEGDTPGADWEATVISGSVLDIPLDMYSTATTSGYYNADAVCGKTSYSGIDFPVDLVSYSGEVETVSGTISYFYKEVICAVSGTRGYTFDIGLLSLKISNFSLEEDGYSVSSGTICVDITDDVYNVVTSGTYFIIGETIVSGTFTPITDGYTMCYDSLDDFAIMTGATTVTVHASNDNNDILEQDFYLTSGYIVEYDNRQQNYGFGSTVVVRGTAENMASCPATGVDAYAFETLPKEGVSLGATIVGIPWETKDLSAEITPKTGTIYFYGKTFRIEARAKDFAGNVMEPFTFEFKIEDKPE